MVTGPRKTNRRGVPGRTRVRRTRGVVSGVALVVLGIWGGLVAFVGPIFDYAYTPAEAWNYTNGRLWLEILPGIAAIIGGLFLLVGANRVVMSFGGWLAATGGAWFVVGQPLSMLWNDGLPAAGSPVGDAGSLQAVVEQIGFFSGLGVVIVFFAAVALGRLSVVGVVDARLGEGRPDEGSLGHDSGTHEAR